MHITFQTNCPRRTLFMRADIQGNLKIRLNEPINNEIIYSFRDKQEIFNLFKKLEWNIYGLELEEEIHGGMYLIKFGKSRL